MVSNSGFCSPQLKLIICLAINTATVANTQEVTRSILFVEDQHYITVEYDLENLYRKYKSAKEILLDTQQLKVALPDTKERRDICISKHINLLNHLALTSDNIMVKDASIQPRLRSKRSLEILGELWSAMSGTASPKEWHSAQHALDDIKKIQQK